MSTSDFTFDTKDALEACGIQYILITLQEFKDGSDKVDAFVNVKSDEALIKIQKGVVEAMKNRAAEKDNPKDKGSSPHIDKPKKKP